jgi:molybdate transport system substrate-binding protein
LRRNGLNVPHCLVVAVLALSPAGAGQVSVIMSGGFSAAYQQLLPEFEKTTGITVTTTRGPSQGDGPSTIGAQLRRGLSADMVIMNREGLEELIAEGRVIADTVVDLADVPLGLAVRHGAIKPEIATVDGFKELLLEAKSIASDSSALIFVKTELLRQLGVADTVAAKVVDKGADAVARGECDLVILPVSELLQARGVDFVGTLPVGIQHVSVFSAAIVTGAKDLDASQRLIAFLTSEKATAAITKSGMEPSRGHPEKFERPSDQPVHPEDIGHAFGSNRPRSSIVFVERRPDNGGIKSIFGCTRGSRNE